MTTPSNIANGQSNHSYAPNAPYDELVGRKQDQQSVIAALDDARLVTLTGPGGIGKSKLAHSVIGEMQRRFVDGVVVVDLESVSQEDVMLLALARALEVSLQPSPCWTDQIAEYLHSRDLLLILDNFEYLIDFVQPISRFIRVAPDVKFLITSRERLNIPGESAIEVRGLSMTAQSHLNGRSAGDDLSPAEQLFVRRARQVKPNFILSEEDRPHVQRICRLVDGMPLAIDLAASWVTLLPCRFIAEQISGNIDWLTTSVGFTHGQQKSVRAVLDYFWGMLSRSEQIVVQQLAVFQDGFDRDLAREVADASPFFLAALVDRAFLQRGSTGRYGMHDLLKQYALEALRRAPEQYRDARERHARAMLRFIHRARIGLEGGGQQFDWISRIDAEQGNWRAAFDWFLGEGNDADAACLIVHGMHVYWYQFGLVTEGRKWLMRALAASKADTPALAAALSAGAFLLAAQSDYDEARDLCARSQTIYRQQNDPRGLGDALRNQAFIEASAGDQQRAVQLFDEVLAVADQYGLGYSAGVAWHNKGYALETLGELAEAEVCFRKSIALAVEQNDQIGIAYSMSQLAVVCLKQGCVDEIVSGLIDALKVLDAAGDVIGAIGSIEAAAYILATRHTAEADAVRILAVSDTLRTTLNLPRDAYEDRTAEIHANLLKQALGSLRFTHEWDAGRLQSLKVAIGMAVAGLGEISPTE